MEIKDIAQLPELAGLRAREGQRPTAAPVEGEQSFSSMLKDSLHEVNRLQQEAGDAIGSYAKGENANLQDTMIAIQQADVSFRMLMQVRNRIVDAYQEILRMQV